MPCLPPARASIATRSPVSDSTHQRAERLRRSSQAAADIARYYDLDVADERDDIDMYLALASAADGPILELACGSGRICVPLAEAGHAVTGVDIDAAMLARARSLWAAASAPPAGTLELIAGDITKLDLGRRFDLVILGFNSLLVIGAGDAAGQTAALRAMARHLTPDGRAVIDTWLPSAEDLEVYDGREVHEWTRTDAATGDQVTKSVSATFDPRTRRATIDTHFDERAATNAQPSRRISRRDEVHFPTRDELLDMIESAGLEPQQVAGDYHMNPLEADSERVIVVSALGRSSPNSTGKQRI